MPVEKVKLKDGSIGYRWGKSGKVYKKRKDAEKQGLAILLSQRKRMKKSTYNELMKKVEKLEKLVNGEKGSGNFGHAGRPGERGGSASGGGIAVSKEEIDPAIQDILSMEKTELEALKKWRARGDFDDEKYAKMRKDVKRRYHRQLTLRQVKPGDTLKITPSDKVPNFDKKIKVSSIGDEVFYYGASETSDGKSYPWWAIKDLEIVSRKKK